MRLEDFDYSLPPELIAQHPAAERDGARMLVLDRQSGRIEDRLRDHWFRELPDILCPGDLVVVNDSRVFPARLYGRRMGIAAHPQPGARNPAHREFLRRRIEVLLTRRLDEATWEALVRPGQKLPVGERLVFGPNRGLNGAGAGAGEGEGVALEAEIVGRGEFGERQLRFSWQGDFFRLLERLGRMPLPPYIHRPRGGDANADAADTVEDRTRYQTIFATAAGSAAAPTAGLHFTAPLLQGLAARGIERTAITLEIGLGTFQPVRAPIVERHIMHAERYRIGAEAAAAIERARRERRRIVAVGTTVVRALEASAARHDGRVMAEAAETDLFLYPGRPIHIAGALLTNFHAPRSTLLMLVAAFAGRESILAAYRHAIAARYRLLSYGDCMLIS